MYAPLFGCLSLFAAASLTAGAATAQQPAKAALGIALTDDGVRIEASIHGGADARHPVWGVILASASDRVTAPLPGLTVLAESNVLASGPIVDCNLVLKAARPTKGIYHLQAVMLHQDLSFTASAVHTLDFSGDENGPRPAVLDRLALSVEIMESDPLRYAIAARFDATSDGYALVAVGSEPTAGGQTIARFVLEVPGPGEGMLDIAQTLEARVPIGTTAPSDARVEVAVVEEIGDGQDLVFYPVDLDC